MNTYQVIFMWNGQRLGEIVVAYNDGQARQHIRMDHPGASIISVTRIS